MMAQGGAFPIIRGAFLGDPHEKVIISWGQNWGPFR